MTQMSMTKAASRCQQKSRMMKLSGKSLSMMKLSNKKTGGYDAVT